MQRVKFCLGDTESIEVDIKSGNETITISNNIDSLYNLAVSTRNDIQAAKSNILVAESNIKLQKAFVLPMPELGVIWNPQNTVPYVGFFGTLRLPILDRNQGEREKSKYLQLQAEQNLKKTKLNYRTKGKQPFHPIKS